MGILLYKLPLAIFGKYTNQHQDQMDHSRMDLVMYTSSLYESIVQIFFMSMIKPNFSEMKKAKRNWVCVVL